MGNIKQVNIVDQSLEDLRKYASYINRMRSTPHGKDGLKIIHKRLLVAAIRIDGAYGNKKVKSSAVVGSTMKYYHPHGDLAIYGAMKPMANWFEIMVPLLEGIGNWGNMYGDSAAAPRYTEVRASQFGYEAVYGDLIETDKVADWNPTYDSSGLEPEALPVKVPLLLINGTFGIGYGLKVEVPAHNLNEVIDATIAHMQDPTRDVVLIPDQCTPCDIIESNWLSISNKGNGSFKVRGVIDIVQRGKSTALVIRSVPDLVFAEGIKNAIEKMVDEKKLPQIIEIEEESTDESLEIYLILQQGGDPNYVRDMIYKNTQMEKSCNVNLEVVVDNNPVRLSYTAYVDLFLDHRRNTKLRLYCDRLQKLQTEFHKIDAFIKVLVSGEIDNIINMIKKQKTVDDNKIVEYIIKHCTVTDLQAKFIIQSNLKRLSLGYLNQYKERYKELVEGINLHKTIITDPNYINNEIIQELVYFKEKYGSRRRSRIISIAEASNIPQGIFNVIVTHKNCIKKVPVENNLGRFNDDGCKFYMTMNNADNLLLFDEIGRVCKVPVHKIPLSGINTNGTDLRLVNKKFIYPVCSMMSEAVIEQVSKYQAPHYLTVVTKAGMCKRMDINDFLTVPPSGILYTKLNEGDKVLNTIVTSIEDDIVIFSKNKALRLNQQSIPLQKRNTKGLNAINSDTIDGIDIINQSTTDIVVVTQKGKINKFSTHGLPVLARNRKGSNVIKLGKTDTILFIKAVNANNELIIESTNTTVQLKVAEVPAGSSLSAGVPIVPKLTGPIVNITVI